MNAFLRGSAPPGASSPPNNFSVLQSHSAQFSPDASFANSSSLLLQPPGRVSSPDQPLYFAGVTGAAAMDCAGEVVDAAPAQSLTVNNVRRFVRQLRQLEGREADRLSQQADPTAVSGGDTQRRGETSRQEPQGTTEQTSAQAPGDDTDSEELDVYTARSERQVRAFLADLPIVEGVYAPDAVPDSIHDTSTEDAAPQQQWQQQWQMERLRGCTSEELRALVLELHAVLVDTLYDAVTLETNLTEIDEDAAVLERAVGVREEELAMLKMRISTVEDYNEELHDAKREALRKLSEAKTEMALLSQRNAKLSKQLGMKEEELQSSLTTSLNGSQRPSVAAQVERRDMSTLTEVMSTRRDGRASSASVSGAAGGICESPLSLSGRSKSAEAQQELEETQEELRLARQTLFEAEVDRIKLQEQLLELKEATMNTFMTHGRSAYEEQRVKDEQEAALQSMAERCERSEQHAAAVEAEARQLREELEAARAKTEELNKAASVTGRSIQVAPSHNATTPTRSSSSSSSSPARQSASCASSVEPSADALAVTRLSVNMSRSVSVETQMAVLQRQLARAQAEATRLEHDLRTEREKTQRQGQSEKRLLENVAYLTRQLRAREALEREARAIRRSEVNTARGGDSEVGVGSAPASEPRRGRFTVDRSSREDAIKREGGSGGAAAATEEEAATPSKEGEASARREMRHATPELRRRRESLFAALRDAQRASDERRLSMPETQDFSVASSDQNGVTPPRATQQQQHQRELLPPPQEPVVSKDVPKMMLATSAGRKKREEEGEELAASGAIRASYTSSTTTGRAPATPAASAEQPSTSTSSFGLARLSVTSLVSPRAPRSSSFPYLHRDASADCVRLDGASRGPHATPPEAAVAAATSAPKAAADADGGTRVGLQRRAFLHGPVASIQGEDAQVSRRLDGAARQPLASLGTSTSSTITRTAASASHCSQSTEAAATSFVPPEALTPSTLPSAQPRVSRGLSSSRATSSARPAGARSSSVGAGLHRSTPSIPVPSIPATPTAPAAVNAPASTSGINTPTASAAGKGSMIVRGLAATTGGAITAPRRRTASRKIVTSREAKPTSTREGSTSVLR